MRKQFLALGLVTCVVGAGLALGFRESRASGFSAARSASSKAGKTVTHEQVSSEYGKLPLAFEVNLGQSGAQAKFLAHGNGYALFLTPSEAVLALREPAKTKTAPTVPASVLRMELVGASAPSAFTGTDELPGKANYILGKNSANWHTNVPTYRKISEKGIYPGIDLVYYGTQRQLEYDFVVAPQANADAIRLAIQGTRNLRIDQQGELVMTVAGGEVRLEKPVAYQQSGSEKQLVAANYATDAAGNVRFALGAYDRSRALVIDPILAYSTYLGGTNIDGANSVAVAPDDTAFIAGGTFSTDFPTAHPLQPNHGGPDDFSRDAFVAKISADGSTLLYSTYLGGKSQDVANGIAVDPFGDAYVTGTTESPDFPVVNAFNPDCGGDAKCGATYNPQGLIVTNGFVAKLNPEGSGLIYSTFVGYYENVVGLAIAVDADQNAYVTGATGPNITPTVVITPPAQPPPPFVITASAFQPTIASSEDCFISEYSATGTSILYSSYYGGSGENTCNAIAVDASHNAYVTGLTYSTDFPLVGATQATYGGAGDAFLGKINTTGTGAGSLLFSTYLGGAGLDEGNGVAADNSGHVYVAGLTNSSGLPLGSGIGAYSGQGDAFAAEFGTPPLTSALIYFKYLGGSLADSANGIAIDTLGNAYVAGSTVSTDFPSTGAPFQATFNGGNADAFVTEINATGSALVYSSYLGGTNTDIAYGIAVDAATPPSAYVAGQTCSTDFPQANPLPINPGGNCDAFISKVTIQQGLAVNPSGLNFPTQSLGTTSQPLTITVTNGQNPVTISNIVPSTNALNPGDFAFTAPNCVGKTLAAGAQCVISVTFTPSAAGIRKSSLVIQNSGPTNPVIALTGSTSSITLSTSTLNFGSTQNPQPVGATTAASSITVTNTGAIPVTVSSITASGDFAETNNCTTAPLQPTTNCIINVTYTPSAAGTSVGAIAINDSAPGSPQVVLLNGTAVVQHFTITAVQPSATISAGQSATYTLSITPIAGFSQPVSLSCSGLPANATCSASQNPVTLTGSTATQVTLSINTTARTTVPVNPMVKTAPPSSGSIERLALPLLGVLLALAAPWMLGGFLGGFKDRRAIAGMVFAAGLVLFTAGCNGGSNANDPPGTPAGTYQVTVTGTSGSASQSTTLTLKVN